MVAVIFNRKEETHETGEEEMTTQEHPQVQQVKRAMIMQGHFVEAPDGRIGLVTGNLYGVINVQFGGAGPINVFLPYQLRYATRSKVDAAGLSGVPGHVWEER